MIIEKIDSVYSLYPTAVTVSGTEDNFTAVDKDGNSISINMADVNADFVSKQYKNNRQRGVQVGVSTAQYASITEQLDQLYRDINAGKFGADAKTGEWYVGITSVKTAFPKPS